MKPHLVTFLVLAAACAIAPRDVRADEAADVEQARALFREGSKLAREDRWEDARDRFARSLALKRAPITLYSLALAHRSSGHLVDALATFREFLAEPASPATEQFLEPARQAVGEIEASLARVTIRVTPADVPGLELRVDGALAKVAPDDARVLDPGRHEFRASAPSFVPAKETIELRAGAAKTIELRLERSPQTSSLDDEPVRRPPVAPPRSNTLPVALVAGGGALLATGVTLGVVGIHQSSEAPTRDGAQANSARSTALVGDVVAVAGLATIAVGVVLLVKSDAQPTSAQVFVGPNGAWLGGRF